MNLDHVWKRNLANVAINYFSFEGLPTSFELDPLLMWFARELDFCLHLFELRIHKVVSQVISDWFSVGVPF